MGGDNGPRVAVHGAASLCANAGTSSFIFHGREAELDPLLDEFPELKAVSPHRPQRQRHRHGRKAHRQALRKGRGNSSMWAALQSVKDGEADVAISGGNTGALMAMATFCLRPIEGISRPGIAAIWPTLRSRYHRARRRRHDRRRRQAARRFLDSRRGARARPVRQDAPDRRPAQCRHRRDEGPRRGQGSRRDAGRRAAAPGFTYHGFVEGDDIGKGTVDVVVTEGFAGNIALKTAEGTARQVGSYIRNALKADILSMLGALLRRPGAQRPAPQARPAQRQWRRVPRAQRHRHQEPWRHRRGRAIKSALGLAYEMARSRLIDKIAEGMQPLSGSAGCTSAAAHRTARRNRRESIAVYHPRRRRLSAGAHRHQ